MVVFYHIIAILLQKHNQDSIFLTFYLTYHIKS